MVHENKFDDQLNYEEQVEYRSEMRLQIISFILMIFLTLLSFAAVMSEFVSPAFTALFILIMGSIQFGFQIFVFMHMGQKGHEYPTLFISGGVLVALLCIGSLTALIW